MTNTHRDGAGLWVWMADEEIGPVHTALDLRMEHLSNNYDYALSEREACAAVAGRLVEELPPARRPR
jgi:hypothetical protein